MQGRMNAKWLPGVLRAALGLVIVVGLLTMCLAAFSSSSSDEPSAMAAASSSVQSVDHSGAAALAATSDDSADEGFTGDCALLITCIVALGALGALLLLRAFRAGRVLWQRLVPVRRADGVPSRHVTISAFVREPAALVC